MRTVLPHKRNKCGSGVTFLLVSEYFCLNRILFFRVCNILSSLLGFPMPGSRCRMLAFLSSKNEPATHGRCRFFVGCGLAGYPSDAGFWQGATELVALCRVFRVLPLSIHGLWLKRRSWRLVASEGRCFEATWRRQAPVNGRFFATVQKSLRRAGGAAGCGGWFFAGSLAFGNHRGILFLQGRVYRYVEGSAPCVFVMEKENNIRATFVTVIIAHIIEVVFAI